MRVPNNIKKKIRQAGIHYEKGIKLNNEIRDWLMDSLDEEELNDFVTDQLIDSIEQGNNSSEKFIEFLETYRKE